MKQQSMASSISILSISGMICKIVGVFYSIPLAHLIGPHGLALFQLVFPTYNMLLTISSAGIPVAISRMVSQSLAKDDPQNARRIFHVALWMLIALGLISTLILLAGSSMLAERVGDVRAGAGFLVIAPCLLLVCILSAYRGFMQGQQNMVPTAISQLIEQVGKVFLSLPLAAWGMRQGGPVWGAAGALLGITLVEGVAMVYMMLLYRKRLPAFLSIPQAENAPLLGRRDIWRRLWRLSIPITISACIIPLSQFVDSAMLLNRLADAGVPQEMAAPLYGVFSGMVIRIINIPTAFALAISMSLVPAISSTFAIHHRRTVRRHTDTGLRFAFLIGLPCSVGMSLLAEPLMRLFYGRALTPELLHIGGQLLSVSSLTILFFTVVQATSSILQGLHKQRIPMYTLLVGVGLKIVLNYVLVGNPAFGIHGAPIASLVCYFVSMVPNLYYVCKYGRAKVNWMGWIVRPGIATAAMGAVIYLLLTVLPRFNFITLLLIGAGVVTFVGVALAVKAVTTDDFRFLRRKRKTSPPPAYKEVHP